MKRLRINEYKFYSRLGLDIGFGISTFGLICSNDYNKQGRITLHTLTKAYAGAGVACVIWPQTVLIYGTLKAIGAMD